MLELDSFHASRRGRALSVPISARFAPGTVLGLVGPNGAGKSSLLQAIACTGVASAGSARVDGADLASLTARRRARILSLLAQDSATPGELRVRELVGIGHHAGGASGSIEEALELTGIAELAERRIGTLSGGQRQLAQIARVIAQDTPLVLLDEPTSALDLRHQRSILDVARRLADDGVGVLAAIHDLNLAIDYADEAILLREGRVLTSGPVHKVMTGERLGDCFDVPVEILTREDGRRAIFT